MAASNIEQTIAKEQQTHSVVWNMNSWNVGCLPGTWMESEPLAVSKVASGQPPLTWILKFYPRGQGGVDTRPILELYMLPLRSSDFPAAKPNIQFNWSASIPHAHDKGKTVFSFQSPEITVGREGGIWNLDINSKSSTNGYENIQLNCTINSCVFDREAPSRALSQFYHRQHDFDLSVSSSQSLANDWNVVFESPDAEPAADLTVIYGEGETLQVHKSILQVRSPVFRAMFSSQCLEQQTSVLKLDDCFNKTAVTVFFRYLYNGSVLLHSSAGFQAALKELVYLANKYCVSSLLQDVEKCLLEKIALMREHLVFLTELAFVHNLTELRAKCVQLSRMGVFPNMEDQEEVDSFKIVVASHVELAWDLLGLR